MSRFYSHPPYAEDQPLAHTILAVHVLSRGAQAGALVGVLSGTARHLLSKNPSPPPFTNVLLRAAGRGTVVGTGILAVGLLGRMYGKTPIEWADRSWRLLENKGQVVVDDWSLGGAAVGGGLGMARLGGRGLLGGMGLGSLVGVGGYMVWRYGFRGGKL